MATSPFARAAVAGAPRPYVPYTSGAFFRSPVAGAPVDQATTNAFRAFVASHPDQKGTQYPVINGLGTNKWGTAYAEGSATDPIWKLTGNVPASRESPGTTSSSCLAVGSSSSGTCSTVPHVR